MAHRWWSVRAIALLACSDLCLTILLVFQKSIMGCGKNAPEVNCNIFSRNGLMFCDGMSARLQGYVNMQRNVNNCDLCKSLASNSYPVYIMARGIKMH